VLKTLMRRGAFQDLYGLPEPLLCAEVGSAIATTVETAKGPKAPWPIVNAYHESVPLPPW
jgi:hypothetical protein